MKYIFFIIIAFLIVQEVPAQVRLSTMDSITTFAPYDYSYWNTLSGGNYLNRKVSWTALRAGMIDYIDGLANTWALRQTFTGATFSAGSNGGVTFEDSVYNAGTSYLNRVYPTTSSTSQIGTAVNPYQTIWARIFNMPNTEGNDSLSISYDDSVLTFSGNAATTVSFPHLTITESVSIDSGAGFRQVIYEPNSVTTISTNDTTLSLSSVQKYCLALIDLAGNTTSPGISYFNVVGATIGYTIRIVNVDAVFSITLKNRVGNDDNLYITADLTLAQYDFIELMCIDETVNDQIWIETGRSNN